MKYFYALLLIAVFLLAGCAQAVQSTPVPAATFTPAPSPTPEEPRSLSSVLDQPTEIPAVQPDAETPAGSFVQPEVKWDQNPETQIVSATFCCGFAPEEVKINYIPDAQIFGDGRMIWSQVDADGKRRVMEGMLTSEQVSTLLQNAVELGFFEWEELYTDPMSPSDLPSQCLFIKLEDQSRTVCEYYKGAPQAFHDLYDQLASGAGVSGTDYVPEKGFLTTYPTDKPEQTIPVWDADGLGMSLSQATGGIWIEGPALETAWKIVNERPWGGIVQEKDTYYQITLQIPGVSMAQPPEQVE